MQLLLRFGNAQARLNATSPRLVIGGDPASCQLAFQDGSVGQAHAEVYLENGTPFIRDLGSRSGTRIDGAELSSASAPLRPGASVMLGAVPLVIQQEGDTFNQAEHGQPMLPGYAQPPASSPQPTARYGPPPNPMPEPGFSPPTPRPIAVPPELEARARAAATTNEHSYRRQASNSNGVLLLALRGDTHPSNVPIEGYLEYTATVAETIAAILVELVERPRNAPSGRVCDRVIVRQGPWNAQRNETVHAPFSLRIPPPTQRDEAGSWEIKGFVDVGSGQHLECVCPINVVMQG